MILKDITLADRKRLTSHYPVLLASETGSGKTQKTDKAINKNNTVGINISLGSTGWKDHKDLQKNFFSMEP